MSKVEQKVSRAIPRGIANTGPVIFSYGFRPFFLGAGLWAIVAMAIWMMSLMGSAEVGGSYGAVYWHAHEMLFGFSSAVLAGFLLTAVPNWTGRLPVSGWPLVLLFSLWCVGRVALLFPDFAGVVPSAVLESLFLPTLLFICASEVVAGRKWKDLKVIAGLLALSIANIAFHVSVIGGASDNSIAVRLAVSAYVALVTIVGGRILPSFTRNWLNRFGRVDFPVPYNRFDTIAILCGVAALAFWTALPDSSLTILPAAAAALLHAVRLARWRGWTVRREKLLLILHVAYGFLPLGFASIALGAAGILNEYSVLHVLTIGAIACMMLAVITRASRGHTGRALTASWLTSASYILLVMAALVRPFAEVLPIFATSIYAIAGLLWIAAFGLFCLEYAPMLLLARRSS
ncbi:NnrS family protein [Rhizobium mayense]|uniref:NnrS family protein n=1 Tax=Rhizobium mayense TaxID=1312184 RepID=A0ABT7K1L3_9HYPH|nr:NnrS family protein [Rhizobium mayense]MDL2402501.1 NnrS family protein [Rhizobium mayense]